MTSFRERAFGGLGLLCIGAAGAAVAGLWFVFALLCWSFLGVAFLLGITPAARRRAIPWLVLIGLVHFGLLVALTLAGPDDLLFGLPAGWVLLVFGIWPAGVLPNLFFQLIFDRWVLPTGAIEKVTASRSRR